MCAVLGPLFVLLSHTSPTLYGLPVSDAYVFDPAPFSPPWILRTLLPWVGVLGSALLVGGIAGLVVRDRSVAGRWRRQSGYVAFSGLVLLVIAQALFTMAPDDDSAAVFLVLLGVLVGLVGSGMALIGLVVMGLQYIRTTRSAIGYVLVGGSFLSVAGTVVGAYTERSVALLPILLTSFVVGYELWRRPAPLPEAGLGDTTASSSSTYESTGESPGREGAQVFGSSLTVVEVVVGVSGGIVAGCITLFGIAMAFEVRTLFFLLWPLLPIAIVAFFVCMVGVLFIVTD